MEEFIGQENKNLYEALTSSRYEVSWPTECRNCDWEYSDDMKRGVVEGILKNPMVDYLRIVSDTFKTTIPETMKVRYCCINNFRPLIKNKSGFEPPMDEDIRYHTCTETIVVEEGLYEWYNLTWSIDDTDILKEAETDVSTPKPQNLIPEGGCRGEFCLVDFVEQIAS